MECLKHFFECYFHQNEFFNNFDSIIKNYQKSERTYIQNEFITELSSIIKTESYEAAKDLINNCWMPLDLEETIKMVHFLYAKSNSSNCASFVMSIKTGPGLPLLAM